MSTEGTALDGMEQEDRNKDVTEGVLLEERPARLLVRGTPRDSTFSSRLSTVIRRSLRLGPKRSTTATDLGSLAGVGKSLSDQETDVHGRGAKYFTEYAEVKIEHYPKPYGTLPELKRLLQLARRSSIKRFVRHNNWPIGHEIRIDLWKELCRDRDFDANKQLYGHEVQVMLQNGVKTLRASFLSAEGVVMHDFGLREIGAVSLQRLLIVIECVRPEITYVPVLYPLCALFLHYMSEEETFSCMMHLMRAGNTYLQQSFVAVTASSRTLLALLKRHKSSVYNLLKRRVGTTNEAILVRALRDWPSWLFRHLPFEYAVRVVDCFIVEGHKMLMRVAIAIVYIWSKEKKRDYSSFAMKSCEERADALGQQFAETAANCPVSVQTLLDAAVGIRNLKGSTITRYQKEFEDAVRDEKVSMNIPRVLPSSKLLYTSPFTSQIVNADVATAIMCSLPNRFQLETPRILFRLSDDGSSFTQLWTKIDEAEQTLFVIKSSNGEVFGAYCSASWAERYDAHERARSRYFGTGESFVWKVDVESGQLCVYTWVGNRGHCADNCPQMFMAADDKSLVIGSGGGDAIAIRDELYRGISSACSTFGSPPLIKDPVSIEEHFQHDDIIAGVHDVFCLAVSGNRSMDGHD